MQACNAFLWFIIRFCNDPSDAPVVKGQYNICTFTGKADKFGKSCVWMRNINGACHVVDSPIFRIACFRLFTIAK